MKYESAKETRINLFNKFLSELKEDYIKTYPNYRNLSYSLITSLLCEQLKIYPKDACKLIEMAIAKGDLEEKREIFLSQKIKDELGVIIEKNKLEIDKEIKEAGLNVE